MEGWRGGGAEAKGYGTLQRGAGRLMQTDPQDLVQTAIKTTACHSHQDHMITAHFKAIVIRGL